MLITTYTHSAAPQFTNAINAISVAKVSYPFKETFIKAIMANWFVVLAVWQATAAQTMGGKFIACLSGISVSAGSFHSCSYRVHFSAGLVLDEPASQCLAQRACLAVPAVQLGLQCSSRTGR